MNGKASGSSRSYILGAAVTFIFILFCSFVSLNEDIASKIDFQAYVSEKNSVPRKFLSFLPIGSRLAVLFVIAAAATLSHG